MKPFLHTEGLAVGYNGRLLLEEVCLAVRRGEILTLIGPNGAGKSTILKTIARQLTPIRGTVYLDGDSVWGMPEGELAKRLALVTTGRVDPELMTCLDVVETGRYPYTGRLGILSREDRRIAAEALAQVGGEALAERPFACISDGQRQRILLARALCQQPDVIVLDEPTSYLDIRHKLELLNLLKRLVHQKQLAVVMSLHELDLAQRVSDTVVCVNGSCIERCGTPEEIFTADYIRRLYDLTGGSYEPVFGSVELEAVPGPPRVFVIGGGGSGVPVYRRLQRQGIAFAAGILAPNDLDYPTAKALAACLVEEAPYAPIRPETLEAAKQTLSACESAMCTLPEFGPLNEANRALWAFAGQLGKQSALD